MPLLSEDVTIAGGKIVTVAVTASPQIINANSITVAASGALRLSSGSLGDEVDCHIATNLTINGTMTVGGALNGVCAQIFFADNAPQITGSGALIFGDSAAAGGINGVVLPSGAGLALGGSISVSGAAWTIDQDAAADGTTQSATVTIGGSATLGIVDNTSVLHGTLHLNQGLQLINDGTLTLHSGASIAYDGNPHSDFTQSASGQLNWTLNGNALDAILLPHSAHLAGTLRLTRPGSFLPDAGELVFLLNQVQSNIIGDFTSFSGAADFTKVFAPPSRSYSYAALGTFTAIPVIVTVDSQSRHIGEGNPPNTFSVSGLSAGDSAASLGTPIYAGSGTTANGATVAGSYPITVSFPANASYSITSGPTAYLTILAGLQSQTITFAALAPLMTSSPARPLDATASSLLPVFYLSGNTAIATVDNTHHTVTAVAPGVVDITACQTGDGTFAYAPSITRSLSVISPLAQTITFQINGGAPLTLAVGTSIALIGTSSAGLPLTYASSDASIASISGTLLTAQSIGTVTVTASQAGDATHASATPQTSTAVIVGETTTAATTVTSSGNCGAGGGVAVILGALLLGWRRRA